MDSSYATIRVVRSESVLTIVLNRPEKRNAINFDMGREIGAALQDAEANADIRVVLLCGEGPSFCSGHDIGGPVNSRAVEERLELERREFFDRTMYLRNFPKPTIVAVQGHCIAAGLMLSQACDLVVAAENAQFSNPVLRMGGAGVEIMFEPWDMGIRRAKHFLFTGDVMSAAEALRCGIVSMVVPTDSLQAESEALAARIALMPPVTVGLVKRSLNKTQDLMGWRDAVDFHFLAHQVGHATDESERLLHERRRGKSIRQFIHERDQRFRNADEGRDGQA